MLDHVFTDAIGALRASLELAMLERRAVEERFTTDVLSGDMRWETSYSIPGEGDPPTVQADIALTWATWAQGAYRRWILTGELTAVPAIDAEVIVRAQDLSHAPDLANVIASLPTSSPALGQRTLIRNDTATTEAAHTEDGEVVGHALEIGYEGTIDVHADALADGNTLDDLFAPVGPWLSSSLITLSDSL